MLTAYVVFPSWEARSALLPCPRPNSKPPAFDVIVPPSKPANCAPVAGKSTLNRLRSKETPSLYHKIGHDGAAIEKLLVDLFLESHASAPEEIILDLVVRFLRRPTPSRQIAQGRHRRECGRGR
jgi:hypothetical protein